MHVSKFAPLLLGLTLGACGAPASKAGQIPAGAPSRPVDTDGDGSMDGIQYDTDGDGKFDAVDVDGDGILDGGDFDGDGVVTVFSRLGTGSLMPTAEQLALYPEDVDPDFDAQLDADGKSDGPPPSVTTRPSVDLTSILPRPANQGGLGSCAAFAVANVATAFRAGRQRVDPNTVWASPQFLYARMLKASDGKCDNGTYPEDGLATLVVEGATPNATLPYTDKSCAMDPALQEGHPYRVGSFELLKPFNKDKVREALSKGTPIVFWTTLPPNFGSFGGAAAKGVFKSDNGQMSGKHGGGHAMVIAGYDDAKGAYRVLNSWGTDWGDQGYIWWDYADLDGREGVGGLAVFSYPELPPVFSPVTEPMLTLQVQAALAVKTAGGDRLIARVLANAPVLIQSVALDDQPAVEREQFLAFGNLSVHAKQPLTPGAHRLVVSGRLASGLMPHQARQNGPQFSRTLMVTVGDAVTDPDGRL